MTSAEVMSWVVERRHARRQRVRRLPLTAMSDWSFDVDTGNLGHVSGRFFTVEGLRVRTDFGPVREWSQPIIHQAEIGVLGIAMREIDGLLHCLMQTKIEPGNIDGVQLAPTVQATRSNYLRVHGGAAVPYLECFIGVDPGHVVADVLQSEQGSWFYRKRNRNMVVEVGDDVEATEDFRWLTLGQVYELLRVDNLVSMDARTVLSCLTRDTAAAAGRPGDAVPADFERSLASSGDADENGLHTETEVLSWVTEMHARYELGSTLVPLNEITRWQRSSHAIAHELGVFFNVVALDVESEGREVRAWQQPIIEPVGIGVCALLVRSFGGVLHALVQARVEPGCLDVIELAPTVQCTPTSYARLPPGSAPPLLDLVLAGRPEKIRFDAELSEEGGRFLHARSRYLIIEVDEEIGAAAPPGFHWLTVRQLGDLLTHSHYVNVQARTLIACLVSL
ncbi:oxidase EvaA [Actinoalloteichus hoggarensis]|nr:NDP-hexose 2,3-dehydratase family protein [Actinoalloteichus hoggarensis]MBB5924482.1 oxidase EvaA [Actinoalloteichus hoggarensis]